MSPEKGKGEIKKKKCVWAAIGEKSSTLRGLSVENLGEKKKSRPSKTRKWPQKIGGGKPEGGRRFKKRKPKGPT